ncbi:putative Blue (type 1) copper binding protein [Helianthus annuus]|uniref:Blue (Type 1) copper binding protein n=1 Tax=Helianthus annuus TaxID=4232 RepID=A0A251SCH1_HELAN|nr:mavicyanin [Helianthus annuus]KAF5764482.1 putative Blue (type 1) copper binding protein [Helianthus annuus]KAJ0451147.1 putative Blue (type 1) copper binding protein [Helianthus annuus]KAJ0455564.1 putative Blue (type 1) copper binding protein [Helianthus annuus]KAJ0473018.1 putative Blue (type 1) copper binding protein [Helianthus annuus]KAJ0648621.1 putative Blue (type 1) copper binding protein [Helianthus annuus]
MAHAMMKAILLSIVATTMLFELALGADHAVGGTGGSWDQVTDLKTWASSETFTVGDNLVFTYTSNHDVLEVSKDDYDSCSIANPVTSNTASPTTIALKDAGSRYFICGTPGHCDQGMKVEIKTVAASSGPPTTTTPPSSDSPTTTTPPSSDSPTPPVSTKSPPASSGDEPPKPSSATIVKMSVVSMVGIGFLMMM